MKDTFGKDKVTEDELIEVLEQLKTRLYIFIYTILFYLFP